MRFEPDVPCRIMATRPCVKIVDKKIIERTYECPAGKCARFEVRESY